MYFKNFTYLFFMLLVFLLFSCSKKDKKITPPIQPPSDTTTNNPPPHDTLPVFADDMPPTDNSTPTTTITWDVSAKKISESVGNAEYPRVHRLGGDTLLMTYHTFSASAGFGEDIILRKSIDNGKTWSAPEMLIDHTVTYYAGRQYYGFQNPDILVLNNGWIMLAYVGRGKPDNNENDDVEMILSPDRGNTWTKPRIIAKGRSWEPAMVQLPDGTIDLFYSSEAKWFPSSNVQQEILMISSKDNGNTWSKPKTTAYSAGHRDGMAVPVLLNDHKGIVFAIESVGQKMPWIVWSSLTANFYYKSYATTSNSRRWYANLSAPGGAPYLIQLPNGQTVISFQASGGRNIGAQWKNSTQLVLIGNSIAKNFTNASVAWPGLPTNEGAYFSGLCLINDSTLLTASTRHFPDGHSEIWTKEGHIHY